MATIGIDVTAALTQGGGIGRYTRELVQALAATDPDHTFTLFSAKPPAALPVADPLPTHPRFRHTPSRFDERWLYRLWYRARLPLVVQSTTGPLDLFHSPDFVLPPVSGGIPTLLTVHDLSFVHFPEVFTPKLVDYLNRVVPWSVGRASHILADSAATQRDLIDIWGVSAAKITVLHCGVHARFRPQPAARVAAVRERYGLGERPFVLAVGTIQPRKNYRLLIRAFRAVAEQLPHQLVIAGGKGWLYAEILAEVAAQGLEDRVLFTGFVADEDLPALYSGAELLAFPSLYEGFGLPLLESMACGTAVLTSDASSLPEVGGEAVVYCTPDDEAGWARELHNLLTAPERRAELIAAGHAQAERFSWEAAAERLLQVYARLLKGEY